MGAEDIRKEYLEWLCRLVGADPDHTLLWRKLHNIMFTWVLPMDENRAEDGKYLRYLFSLEKPEIDREEVDYALSGPCSVMEFLVGLAKRIEDDILYSVDSDDRTGEWFWEMIDNLGLEKYDDSAYSEVEVDDIVTRFLTRKYGKSGAGNVFKIGPSGTKSIEIWNQAQYWASQK